MISIIKKQLLKLVLVAGIAVPVSAMDTSSESAFGWKSAAGVSALVCAGVAYWAYAKWTTPKAELKVEGFVEIESDNAPTLSAGAASTGTTIVLDTPEDLQRAQADADAEIAKLEAEIAQGQQGKVATPVTTAVKKPKGQAGRAKPSRKPVAVNAQESEQEDPEVVAKAQPAVAPAAPKKPLNGQGYGVQLGDLQKTKLKKTVKKAPAKK